MIPSFINKSQLSHKPGVYQFLNKERQVLYIGKAIDLYSRVASYFNKDISGLPAGRQGKTAVLVENIAAVETIIVESEIEALILEANLIKKYLPPFNVILKDGKDYLYIGITKEDFPKIITIRKQDLKNVKNSFGPFPSSRTVRETLKQLRRVFPWCSNPPKSSFKPLGFEPKYKACFYYHIGLCPGACVGAVSKDDYQKIIRRFSKFLAGNKEELVTELTLEMEQSAKEQKFEEAGELKKILQGIFYLTQTNRVSRYLENPNFLEEEHKQTLLDLQKDLGLSELPERIEGYDISNLGGKEAVGSMVVLTNGEIDKSQYRKFKIHISGKPNDVGMHKEMMRRRFKHKEWLYPDLIIIDGGRAQANAAYSVLVANNLKIPVFGLAKRMEWLYLPEGEISASLSNSRDARIIKLPRKSLALRLLQKLRDESHRFAVIFHRKLRDRDMIKK